MRKTLEEVRVMAGTLRQGVFQSEEIVNALIDGIIYRADSLLGQSEQEMVCRVAEKAGLTDERAKAALHA